MPAKVRTKTKKATRSGTAATKRKPQTKATSKLRKLAAELRTFAASFDGAREDYPWGGRVVKGPDGKVFVFLGDPYMLDGQLCLTVKLPKSRKEVLELPFAKPCGYGLGKHGWVTLRITPLQTPPSLKSMQRWIAESHASVSRA